ncbi:PLP-dependent aminotransferase family protein [Streptomyces sp. NPDC090025]|uniref:aminotransferase-like domain-containing protein n=1 Tax=Streptomyces sp. NPDC090025 TaxID=3365922 RepID=UPI003833B576
MTPALGELVAWLGRWSAGRGPLYLLLAARLRQLIDEGLLPPGAPLPPDRRLATALSVGRTTVVAAYETLRQEGRLVRRQGSGTRVAPAALGPREPATPGAGPGHVHGPGSGSGSGSSPAPRVTETSNPLFLHLLEPDDDVILLTCAAPLAPPPAVREAYRTLDLPTEDLGYHPAGLPALRAAVAARYARRGVPTEPHQILVTTGAQQALALLTRLLVAPGDGVLVEAPAYPGALDLFREAATVLHPVAVGPYGIDVEAAIQVMERHRPALAYVIPRFQNPTGAVLPPLLGRRLVAAERACGVPLVDDEVPAELDFVGGGGGGAGRAVPLSAYGSELSEASEVIAVGSLSKAVWGGLRIGWVRGPAPLVARLARLKALHDLGSNVPGQLVAARLLYDGSESSSGSSGSGGSESPDGSGGFDGLVHARVAELRAGHDLLRAELARLLPSWHCPPVTGGQTLWVELPHGDGVSFAQLALRHGVAVLPGSTMDALGGSTRALRLHFLLPHARLREAVRRLAAAWQEYAAGPARTGAAGGEPVPASLNAIAV